MKKRRTLMALMLAALAVTSCGGDNDDDDSSASNTTGTTGVPPQREEETCLSNTRREEIRTFLNEISDRDINGTGSVYQLEGDNEINLDIVATYRFTPTSESNWNMNAVACDANNLSNCVRNTETFSFRNGCFFVGNSQARVTSSSDTSLSYRYTDSSGSVSESGSVSTGKVRLRGTTIKNGITVNRTIFNEI